MVNKIYKQRMEDPPPLEKITKGVPAAFAAIVRKLMAKAPGDRYQTGEDLQADLARWTDPKVVRSILGSEADVARAFRPPPPELEDEDLRLLPESRDLSAPNSSLRDLPDSEPGAAPRRRVPPVVRPAVVVKDASIEAMVPDGPVGWAEATPWLIPFIAIVCVLGLLAIVLIAAMGH